LIAFGLRAAHLLAFRRTAFFEVPIFDEAFYDEHAQAIATGDWGGRDAFFMGPLYSYFLGLLYMVFQGSRLLALLAQSALGSLTCVLAFFIGRKLFSAKIGTAAAAVCCVYGILVFYEGFLLMETLVLCLNMLCVLLLVKAAETRRYSLFLAAGVPLGLSALGRASILTFAVVVAIWLYWSIRGSSRFRTACLGAFALGILLVVMPVSFRNYLTEGDLVIVSANGGLNFYIGNGPGATGTFRIIEDQAPAPGDMTGRFLAQEAEGRTLTLAEVSDWWYSESWSYIRDKPWAFLKNWVWKYYLFWNSFEIPQLEWYEATREDDPILSLPLVSSRLIIPLSLIGFVLSARWFRRVGILHSYVVAQAITMSLFFVTGRYRIAALPVLAIFASYTVFRFLEEWGSRRLWGVLGILAAFILLFWATSPSRLSINMDEIERWHRTNLALRYSRIGSGLGTARGILAQVTEDYPESADSHRFYGTVLRKLGEYEAADEELRRAWTLHPRPEVLLELGELYSEIGNDSLAVKAYRDAISIAPLYKAAREKLAFAYVKIGREKEAIEELTRALEMDPADASLRVNLGVTYGKLGMKDEAIRQFRVALQYDALNWKARYNLAAALAEKGHLDEARSQLETILEEAPDNKVVRQALLKLKE
jgi:Flp pilus assembly protein TadD/4-amino-4-deoxy-L-arabinose transferase-like glycosyltransferase